MKQKRYAVSINIELSAKNEKEAKRIMKEIVESGTALGSEGTKLASIVLNNDPIVKELPF